MPASAASRLFDLTGRTALVTGSSQGLGFAVARGLAEAGATVVLNGRDTGRLEQAVARLADDGLAVHASCFDVTDGAAIADAVARLGPLDILVNNAGVQRRGPLESIDEATWRLVIDTNLTGVFLTTRAVVPAMIERRAGKIINMASVASVLARKTTAPYAAAKGGLMMLTRAMATEWAGYNIHRPGLFRDGDERRHPGQARVRQLGQGAHAGRPLGQARGTGGHGDLSRVGRRRLRDRPHAVRRRRVVGVAVN
jgi:gluconate 5-dehydrogenase